MEVVVVSQTDIRRVIAKSDQGITIGKEVVVFGPKLAAGVITVVVGTHHTATVAHHHPRVMAIPVAAVAV